MTVGSNACAGSHVFAWITVNEFSFQFLSAFWNPPNGSNCGLRFWEKSIPKRTACAFTFWVQTGNVAWNTPGPSHHMIRRELCLSDRRIFSFPQQRANLKRP